MHVISSRGVAAGGQRARQAMMAQAMDEARAAVCTERPLEVRVS